MAALPASVFAQGKADELVKLVTVCEVLRDPAQFNGKAVAVLGHLEYMAKFWLTDAACGRSLQLEARNSPAPNSPFGELSLDRLAVLARIQGARKSERPADRFWTIEFGWFVEGDASAALIYDSQYELWFDDEGRRVEVVLTDYDHGLIHGPGGIPATLCELTSAPAHYHGQVVQLRTSVRPAGIDTPNALFDRSCPAEIRLDIPKEIPFDHGQRPFNATISGKFEQILVLNGLSYLRLTLQSISDIAAKP